MTERLSLSFLFVLLVFTAGCAEQVRDAGATLPPACTSRLVCTGAVVGS